MRKSKKQREDRKKHNDRVKQLTKIYDKQKYDIRVENVILTYFNMLSTEYIRYTGEIDTSIVSNTKYVIARLNKMIQQKHKNRSLYSLNVKTLYKPVLSYLKGVNERIGDINDFKDNDILIRCAEKEFVESEKDKEKLQHKGILYEFMIGDEAGMLLVHTGYALLTLKRLIKKANFKKDIQKYLKTAITKMQKVYNDIEEEIFKMNQYYTDNFQYLTKSNQISYLLHFNCELAGIKSDKENKKYWNSYFQELKEMSEKDIIIEFESTQELISKYEKTKFIKKAS